MTHEKSELERHPAICHNICVWWADSSFSGPLSCGARAGYVAGVRDAIGARNAATDHINRSLRDELTFLFLVALTMET